MGRSFDYTMYGDTEIYDSLRWTFYSIRNDICRVMSGEKCFKMRLFHFDCLYKFGFGLMRCIVAISCIEFILIHFKRKIWHT